MISLQQRDGRVIDPERELKCVGEYDVLVIGGGMAGFGAAVAAARSGYKTLLVERESALGGLATIGLVNIPLDFACGIGQEMLNHLDTVNGHWHRNSDPEKHKLVLDRMLKSSGSDLLLVSHAVDAIVSNGEVRGVIVESKSGREAILARRVIDCTGDADVAFMSGCECMKGRLSDGEHQACSLEFRLGGVDWDKYQESELKKSDPSWIALIEEAVQNGDLPYPIDNHLNWVTHVPGRPQHCGQDEISMCFAHSRHCRPLEARDLTRMYLEGREQADLLWKFIRKCVPGYEKCYLIDTGSLLGVRESRRVVGEYILTTKDFAQCRQFDDVVALSGHHYDLHNPTGPGNIKWAEMEIDGKTCYVGVNASRGSWSPPEGFGNLSDPFGRKGDDRKYPTTPREIPYRSLIPADIDSLLVAGRCLSSEFMAQAGCRLVLTCLNMGQVAGTAAAISLKHRIQPRRIDRVELQRKLIGDGLNIGQKLRKIPGLEV